LTQTTPNNGVWDFDLTLDPAFFSITETYYLEATIDLTFANTGTLTKKLLIPMSSARTLRSQARNVVDLVEVSGRGPSAPAAATQAGVVGKVSDSSCCKRDSNDRSSGYPELVCASWSDCGDCCRSRSCFDCGVYY
jgi:hypothetical protein